MDGGAWWAAVHGVTKSQTQLSDFTFTFHFNALEKEMAAHSSVLAWRSPGMGEPGGLPSMGSHRVGHDWSDLAAAAAATPNNNELPAVLETHMNKHNWSTVLFNFTLTDEEKKDWVLNDFCWIEWKIINSATDNLCFWLNLFLQIYFAD